MPQVNRDPFQNMTPPGVGRLPPLAAGIPFVIHGEIASGKFCVTWAATELLPPAHAVDTKLRPVALKEFFPETIARRGVNFDVEVRDTSSKGSSQFNSAKRAFVKEIRELSAPSH